jgi:hypothetical protein
MSTKEFDKGNGNGREEKEGYSAQLTAELKEKDLNYVVTNFYQEKIKELERRKDRVEITKQVIAKKGQELEKLIKKVQTDIVKTGSAKEDFNAILEGNDLKRTKRIVIKALSKMKLGKIAQKMNFLSPSTALTAAYSHLKNMDEKLVEESTYFENAESEVSDDINSLYKDRDECRQKKYGDMEKIKNLILEKREFQSQLELTSKEKQEEAYYDLEKRLFETERNLKAAEKSINEAGVVGRFIDNRMDGNKAYLKELEVMQTNLGLVQEPVKMLIENYEAQIKNQTRLLKMGEDIQAQAERIINVRELFNTTIEYAMLDMGKLVEQHKALNEPLFKQETLRLTAGVAEDVKKKIELNRVKEAYKNIKEVEDGYTTLGLKLGDDETAIQAAFRSKVRITHPDLNQDAKAREGVQGIDLDRLAQAKEICIEYAKSIKQGKGEDNRGDQSGFMHDEQGDEQGKQKYTAPPRPGAQQDA